MDTFGKEYKAELIDLIKLLDLDKLRELSDLFIETSKKKGTVYFIGNGGSASTANHFSCDLGKGCKSINFNVKTESPMDNVAIMSAYSNDIDYHTAIKNYLEHRINSNDLIVFISASGNSPNLVHVADLAKQMQVKTVGLLGFDGGKLNNMCDLSIVVRTPKGKYGLVEDVHMIICHLTTNYMMLKHKTV